MGARMGRRINLGGGRDIGPGASCKGIPAGLAVRPDWRDLLLPFGLLPRRARFVVLGLFVLMIVVTTLIPMPGPYPAATPHPESPPVAAVSDPPPVDEVATHAVEAPAGVAAAVRIEGTTDDPATEMGQPIPGPSEPETQLTAGESAPGAGPAPEIVPLEPRSKGPSEERIEVLNSTLALRKKRAASNSPAQHRRLAVGQAVNQLMNLTRQRAAQANGGPGRVGFGGGLSGGHPKRPTVVFPDLRSVAGDPGR